MKYCHHCAAPLVQRIPQGDDKLRYCCDDCDTIFYQNPKNVVGTIPVYGDQVLLCRRAIEPRRGLWTLPAGFMENGESSLDGAIRETAEEAGARIELHPDSLYTLFNLPAINQVYMFFRAELLDLEFEAGAESLEVALFHQHEIPWQDIAFQVVKSTLEHYFEDAPRQHFPVRMFDVHHDDKRKITTELRSNSSVQRKPEDEA